MLEYSSLTFALGSVVETVGGWTPLPCGGAG